MVASLRMTESWSTVPKIVSPLAIRFSQPRICPTFRNGAAVDDVLPTMTVLPPPPGCPFDGLIVAPFPEIEVLRFRPKCGEDLDREERFDGWFSLDNRRLYALQRFATMQFPKLVGVIVMCRVELPSMNALRKFGTTSAGADILVAPKEASSRVKPWTWCWHSAVAASMHAGMQATLERVTREERLPLEEMPSGCVDIFGGTAAAVGGLQNGQEQEDADSDDGLTCDALMAALMAGAAEATPPKAKSGARRGRGQRAATQTQGSTQNAEGTEHRTHDRRRNRGYARKAGQPRAVAVAVS